MFFYDNGRVDLAPIYERIARLSLELEQTHEPKYFYELMNSIQ